MTELETYKKDMLQALRKMKVAYNEFKNTLIEWDGVEKDFSKDYPFQYDIFDYDIERWLNTSIKTIEEIDEEKFEKMSRGY